MLPTATARLYFENNAGRLLEHADGYVVFEYHAGKRVLADLRPLLNHTRSLLAGNQWHRLLGDQRLVPPFTAEESTWIAAHWLDDFHQHPGGIYGAIILAHDVFARLAMTQVMHEAKAPAGGVIERAG